MFRLFRRLFYMAVLTGAGYAAWSMWQRDRDHPPPAAPQWPPFEPRAQPETATSSFASTVPRIVAPEPSDAPAAAGATTWLEPVDGQCPLSHPIKANDNSGIFHVPGGRFYDRTIPERCYADPDDAVSDGYRAAKA